MACCGLSGKGMTSMFGLLAILVLSMVFGVLGLGLFYGAGVFSRRSRFWGRTLSAVLVTSVPRMFQELLTDAYFWRPDLKCVVSAKLFRFGPALSGFVFKYFNLIVLSIILGLFVCVVWAGLHFARL